MGLLALYLYKVFNAMRNIRLSQRSTLVRLDLLVVVSAIGGVGDLNAYWLADGQRRDLETWMPNKQV